MLHKSIIRKRKVGKMAKKFVDGKEMEETSIKKTRPLKSLQAYYFVRKKITCKIIFSQSVLTNDKNYPILLIKSIFLK